MSLFGDCDTHSLNGRLPNFGKVVVLVIATSAT